MQNQIPLSERAQNLKLGKYRHFKGGEYKLLGVGRNSEDPSEEFAVYQSLETGYIWIRPLEMFMDAVHRDEYTGPRFTYVEE